MHAGLEADGSADCEAQLSRLRRRDPRQPQPEQLFGRDNVQIFQEAIRVGSNGVPYSDIYSRG